MQSLTNLTIPPIYQPVVTINKYTLEKDLKNSVLYKLKEFEDITLHIFGVYIARFIMSYAY